jgi:hypothetical protein
MRALVLLSHGALSSSPREPVKTVDPATRNPA